MGKTNAERQRRYVARLKQRAAEPHSPDMVLDGLRRLRPMHFPGTVSSFAKLIAAEAERLSVGVANSTLEDPSGVSNGQCDSGANLPKCSFCYQNSGQVTTLFASADQAYICNECVDQCVKHIRLREVIREEAEQAG